MYFFFHSLGTLQYVWMFLRRRFNRKYYLLNSLVAKIENTYDVMSVKQKMKRCDMIYGVVIGVFVFVFIIYLTTRLNIRGPPLLNISFARDQEYEFEIQTVETISYGQQL